MEKGKHFLIERLYHKKTRQIKQIKIGNWKLIDLLSFWESNASEN